MSKSITINGIEYPNLTTALVRLDLTHLTISDIQEIENKYDLVKGDAIHVIYCKENDIDLDVDEMPKRSDKRAISSMVNSKTYYFEWFEKHFGQTFDNFKHLRSFLSQECNKSLFVIPLAPYSTDIIRYLIEGGLEPLTWKRESTEIFEHSGVCFESPREFFDHYEIFSTVFYFNLYRTKGDVEKAIVISQQYTIPTGEVEFDGKVYDSCYTLLKSWGILPRHLHRVLSLNLPFEKALIYTHMLFKVLRDNEVVLCNIPYTFAKLRTQALLRGSVKLDEVLAQYILDGNPLMTLKDFEKFIIELFAKLQEGQK